MDLAARFRQLPQNARMAVLAVAGIAGVYVLARGRRAPEPVEADGEGVQAGTAPLTFDTDVIGSGEIMSILGDLNKEVAGLTQAVDAWDQPQGTSAPAHTVRMTYVLPGETPNAIAIRLRAAGQKTASGKPLTAGYLISFNKIKVAPTTKLFPGMTINY